MNAIRVSGAPAFLQWFAFLVGAVARWLWSLVERHWWVPPVFPRPVDPLRWMWTAVWWLCRPASVRSA